mmetsp:Transcript_43459/g.100765  ORF Transcript_43459/g.100765 Transcript_43459/m.100765 type:complete len:123 (+) Transcript_43459:273-641(+)
MPRLGREAREARSPRADALLLPLKRRWRRWLTTPINAPERLRGRPRPHGCGLRAVALCCLAREALRPRRAPLEPGPLDPCEADLDARAPDKPRRSVRHGGTHTTTELCIGRRLCECARASSP